MPLTFVANSARDLFILTFDDSLQASLLVTHWRILMELGVSFSQLVLSTLKRNSVEKSITFLSKLRSALIQAR